VPQRARILEFRAVTGTTVMEVMKEPEKRNFVVGDYPAPHIFCNKIRFIERKAMH